MFNPLHKNDLRRKVLLFLSSTLAVSSLPLIFVGLWLENHSLVVLFSVFLIIHSLSYLGAIKGATLAIRIFFLISLAGEIFLISEILSDHSMVSMLFLMEMVFVFILLSTNTLYKNLIAFILVSSFALSISGSNILLEPVLIAGAYQKFIQNLLFAMAVVCLWQTLRLLQKDKPVVIQPTIEPEESSVGIDFLQSQLLNPMDTLLGVSELMLEKNDGKELNTLNQSAKIALAQMAAVRSKMLALNSSTSEQKKYHWKTVSPYHFLHRVELRLNEWGLGGQFEYCVDESLHFKEVLLPEEKLHNWLADWLRELGCFRKTDWGSIELSFTKDEAFLSCSGDWDIAPGDFEIQSNQGYKKINLRWEFLKRMCLTEGITLTCGGRRNKLSFTFTIPTNRTLLKNSWQLPMPPFSAKGQLPPLSVLLLQKEMSLANINLIRLEHLGLKPLHFETSKAGLNYLKEKVIDILIVDPHELDIDLKELYTRVKRHSSAQIRKIPIFLFCEEADVKLLSPYSHWDGVIQKPITLVDLLTALKGFAMPAFVKK